MIRRLLLGVRFALLAGVVVGVVGLAGHLTHGTVTGGTWLTATLGPTTYALVAHPREVTSRLRNALIGHAVAVLAGLAALAAFGLWSAPSVAETHNESVAQVLAQATAVGTTLLTVTLLDAHHAPAAATTLLVASGIAAPGTPLVGLLVGLVIVLALAPLLARLPGHPRDVTRVGAPQPKRRPRSASAHASRPNR